MTNLETITKIAQINNLTFEEMELDQEITRFELIKQQIINLIGNQTMTITSLCVITSDQLSIDIELAQEIIYQMIDNEELSTLVNSSSKIYKTNNKR